VPKTEFMGVAKRSVIYKLKWVDEWHMCLRKKKKEDLQAAPEVRFGLV